MVLPTFLNTSLRPNWLAFTSLFLVCCPFLALKDSTMALETVLWGFAGLFIAGIGLRVHTGILGIRGVRGQLLAPSALLWNVGLLLRWVVGGGVWVLPLSMGVMLFLLALRPFRRAHITPAGGAWLRPFVKTSYLWLVTALLLSAATEGGFPQYLSIVAFTATIIGTFAFGKMLHSLPEQSQPQHVFTDENSKGTSTHAALA